MDIAIDHDRCIGAGQCALIAPEVFDQRDDGLALLLVERPDDARLADVREAVESCPMSALSVGEDRRPPA
ncbi:ferredoxin [Streptomyces europaeiscabiei]|uniref:Ferredoxin n=1 Tax=Streptomyces europaeiscabiei TaxID=146819 RepID=A0ABU4NP44_9ACTN|nr:ferredoxin [Streptomyces europaeiscabiei]MDX2528870.1 ferredoxin [Streptomyces europaeiscabiei]MDX2765526.1 ferredoxin [Streptomyces europaeiscabiei]MDX2774832.1 ferredoxin [Streptomyces europaeiscabiei]MDX3546823.1 ferredoxin [Streptomyces europaeiscabiei]MDX3556517.1 ferredoxin [Streptomyces europaeiscabiei]